MSLLNQVLGTLLGHGDAETPSMPAALAAPDFIYLKIPMAQREGHHVTAEEAAREDSRLAHLEVALVEALHAHSRRLRA